MIVHTLRGDTETELVPILVKVQSLQTKLLTRPDIFACCWNWVDAFLRLEHGVDSPYYQMLRQAMMARRALLLLDGLDEGGARRSDIEHHITKVLALVSELLGFDLTFQLTPHP